MLANLIPVLLPVTGPPRLAWSDPFTGTNGTVIGAPWVQTIAGAYNIQNNRAENGSGSYAAITRTAGRGNYTFSWDQDFSSAGATFAQFIFRFTDFNNYCYFQLNGSDILVLHSVVGGTDNSLFTDSVTRNGSGAGACSGVITIAGNSISLTVTGGSQTPGTFGPNTITDNTNGVGFGFGMNTGKAGDWVDNATATPQ
jgi:hypothetical protein